MSSSENKDEISLLKDNSEDYLENIDLSYDIGDYYFENEEYTKALKKYKKALETCIIGSINYQEQSEDFLALEQLLRKQAYNSALNYGNILIKSSKFEEALEYFMEALDLNTGDEIIYSRIGKCFYKLNQADKAIKYLEKSIAINSDYPDSYRTLGNIFTDKQDYRKAINYFEIYTDLDDKNAYVYNMLGYLHHKTQDIKKSLLYFQIAASTNPFFQTAQSNFLYASIKTPEFNQEEIYNLAVNTSESYIENTVIKENIFTHDKRIKNNKIRIGYLSGDIKEHVIMNYFLPILENYNKEEFEIYLYHNDKNDWVTDLSTKYAKKIVNIKSLNDFETAQTIYNDNIEILVDLSGHTAHNKIFAMSYKPAPVQVTYMGYPNTTGIKAIDYFLTNENLSYPEEQQFYTEKLYFTNTIYRVFRYYYTNPLPDVLNIPYFKNNYITFGSFNDLSKINDEVIKVWSEILKRKENSKLLICRSSLIEEYYIDKFREFGIEENRLIFKTKFSLKEYNEIDLHLDTFPFCGVTVIFDSLIMGVPTLTLKGDMFQGREAANINYNLGLNNLIAENKEDYINKAVEISSDIKGLKSLKNSLRNLLFNSDFCNYETFTRELEKCYQDMYSQILT